MERKSSEKLFNCIHMYYFEASKNVDALIEYLKTYSDLNSLFIESTLPFLDDCSGLKELIETNNNLKILSVDCHLGESDALIS